LTASLGFSKQHQDGPWLKISSLRYLRENFDFNGTPQQTVGLLIPSLNWTYVKADDRLRPSDGGRLNLVLQGAYEPLLSDVSFLQAMALGKWIKRLSAKNRLILRGDAAMTWTSDFEKLPASLRFYAGGDNSVRGYKLDNIGPKNAQGNVIGGKNLLVGSLEYEHRVLEKWSIAGFVDSGDAFDQGNPKFKTGVGFGLRWLSPVGPVRVDLASGLSRPPGDTVRLHLTIGPDL
jgi:translocation and assembly module TamA